MGRYVPKPAQRRQYRRYLIAAAKGQKYREYPQWVQVIDELAAVAKALNTDSLNLLRPENAYLYRWAREKLIAEQEAAVEIGKQGASGK